MLDFTVSQTNDNFLYFTATAGFVGKPTRETPCGGNKGYNVVLGDSNNVNELVGAGVNCSYGWNADFKQHDKCFKIGVIDAASVNDDAIKVEGHLWKMDFPDICDTIESAKEALGCSVEVYSYGVVNDDKAKTQTLHDVHFTGLSLVYKNKAAFDGTQFMCSIAATEVDNVSELDIQAAVDKAVESKINELKESLTADFAKMLEEKTAGKEKENAPITPSESPKSFDFKEFADNLIAAVKFSLDSKNENSGGEIKKPARKTNQFISEPQFQSEKSLAELSKEIDDDPNLTPEQKWAAQMKLWNNYQKHSA